MTKTYDVLIIGSGIIGLAIARELIAQQPQARILILDKEEDTAAHASGRNSGVLHAGFYYTADSLKAKFTVEGNHALRTYCKEKGLPLNECGKLVVAQNEQEHQGLFELEKRGRCNGSNIRIIEAKEAQDIDPNVKTYKHALHSPDTASVDPTAVCHTLKNDLKTSGVVFQFQSRYQGHTDNTVHTNQGDFTAKKIINCAGLYADKIAHGFGFGHQYTLLPFKGLYLKYTKNTTDIRTNIYPVPNLKNPFLGVHFTKTVEGGIKIGPTAIPALWRENYKFLQNFNLRELGEIFTYESRLFLQNHFGFRDLAWEEVKKYHRRHFIGLAVKMVKNIDPKGFTEFTKPGIRAQLLERQSLKLVQDFVVEGDGISTHVLNAVSPAFTCAFPFAEFVVKNYILNAQ